MFKRDVIVAFTGQLVRVVFATIGAAFLARGLGVDGRGVYALALWWPSALSMILPIGQLQINSTYAGLHKDRRSQLFFHSVLIALINGALAAGFYVWAFSSQWAPLGEFEQLTPETIFLGAALIPLLAFNVMTREFSRGSERIRSTVAVTSAGFVLQAALTYIVIFRLEMGIEAALVVFLAVTSATTLGYLFLVRQYILPGRMEFSMPFATECLRYGLQYLACSISIVLCVSLPILLLGYMGASNVEIGICSVALGLAQQAEILPTSIAQVFLPRLSNDKEALLPETPRVFRITVLSSVACIIGLCVVAPPAILVLFGRDYSPTIPLVLILLPGFVFASGGRILALHLNVLKRPKYEMAFTWVRVVVMFLGILAGYRLFGLWGVVIAITISRFVRMALLTKAFLRVTDTSPRSLLPTKTDVVQIVHGVAKVCGCVERLRPC